MSQIKNADKRSLLDKYPAPGTASVNAPVGAARKAKRRSKRFYLVVGILLLCLIAFTFGAFAFLARSENPDSFAARGRRLAVSRQERRFMREQEDTDEPPDMASGGVVNSGKGAETVEESLKAEYAPANPHVNSGPRPLPTGKRVSAAERHTKQRSPLDR